LSAGAFSDEKVVAAAQKIQCVFVDCDWGKKNTDLSGKYGVKGYPTVIFVDPDGTEVAKLAGRDAAAVEKQILEIAEKYVKPSFDTVDKAAEKAKEDKKPVLIFFFTTKGDSQALEQALNDESMKEIMEKFAFAKIEIKKDNADAKKYGVAASTQPVLVIVDPAAEKPEAKPIKKLTGKKGPKELKKEFEAALKKFAEDPKPEPKPEPKEGDK
jgi:thioredoxin-related protein